LSDKDGNCYLSKPSDQYGLLSISYISP